MSQKSFLDNKKSRKNFPYVGRGGVNQHMENSICFVVFFFETFPNLFDLNQPTEMFTPFQNLETRSNKIEHDLGTWERPKSLKYCLKVDQPNLLITMGKLGRVLLLVKRVELLWCQRSSKEQGRAKEIHKKKLSKTKTNSEIHF